RSERGPRAHLPRASVTIGSDQGSGTRGGRAHAQPVGAFTGAKESGGQHRIRLMSVAIDSDAPALPPGRLTGWLAPVLAARGMSLDASQTAAFARLQRLTTELESF